MALIFSRSIGNLILDHGIRSVTSNSTVTGTTTGNLTWYIMSGTQPTPAVVINNWSTYYNNNILFKGYSGNSTHIVMTINNRYSYGSANLTASGTRTAAASGTATWAIITSRVDASEPLQSSLTSDPSFIILPVSAQPGSVLQLGSIDLISGSTFSFNLSWFMAGGSN